MTNPFEIDEMTSSALGNSMKTGEAIELPFPALYMWAQNGQAGLKNSGVAVLYFGGWVGKKDQLEDAAARMNATLPKMAPASISPKAGDEFEALTARSLYVSPVSYRKRWIGKDGFTTSADYLPGYRQHVQVLCILGEFSAEKKVVAWGPIVLTAKGYQATNLIKSLSTFDRLIDAERRKVAANIPTHLFWRKVGTFGDKPNFQSVGNDQTSTITPIECERPETVNRDTLAARYIGKDNADYMAELFSKASEWLSAWKQPQAVKSDGPAYDDQGNRLTEDEHPF